MPMSMVRKAAAAPPTWSVSGALFVEKAIGSRDRSLCGARLGVLLMELEVTVNLKCGV